MLSADQIPLTNPHSRMQWPKWIVLIAGSTGSALRAVRPPNLRKRTFAPLALKRIPLETTAINLGVCSSSEFKSDLTSWTDRYYSIVIGACNSAYRWSISPRPCVYAPYKFLACKDSVINPESRQKFPNAKHAVSGKRFNNSSRANVSNSSLGR